MLSVKFKNASYIFKKNKLVHESANLEYEPAS